MSLLTVIQNTCARLAIPVPSGIVSSTDAQVVQLYGLVQMLCQDMAERYSWSKLRKIKTFSATAATEQVGSIPDDFRYYINESMFNRTTTRKIFGPLTAEDWEVELSFPVYASIAPAFRFAASSLDPGASIIWITPNPTLADTIGYEYISNAWCVSNALVAKSAFTADTDTTIFNDNTITMGLLSWWKEAKGLDYAESRVRFEEAFARDSAMDGGKARLNLKYGLNRRLIWAANTPDGNWPG